MKFRELPLASLSFRSIVSPLPPQGKNRMGIETDVFCPLARRISYLLRCRSWISINSRHSGTAACVRRWQHLSSVRCTYTIHEPRGWIRSFGHVCQSSYEKSMLRPWLLLLIIHPDDLKVQTYTSPSDPFSFLLYSCTFSHTPKFRLCLPLPSPFFLHSLKISSVIISVPQRYLLLHRRKTFQISCTTHST